VNIVSQLAAVLAGLIHVLIFVMESVLFRRPVIHRRFGAEAEHLDAVRPWAFNQGWYNLFLAAGALGGVIAAHVGNGEAGRSIALFSCACMLGAAVVLIASDRAMARPALVQGLAPLAALLAWSVSM
jgi:putative membrane protein